MDLRFKFSDCVAIETTKSCDARDNNDVILVARKIELSTWRPFAESIQISLNEINSILLMAFTVAM